MFVTSPSVSVVDRGRRFRLDEPLVYRGKTQTFTIPAFFTTDFASVPRFLRWLVPAFGVYTLATILHDWFCRLLRKGESPVSARDADAIFRRVMREYRVSFVTRWVVWTGVRWGSLGNSYRREGWLKDAPLVLLISLLVAPLVVPTALTVLVSLVIFRTVEVLAEEVVP